MFFSVTCFGSTIYVWFIDGTEFENVTAFLLLLVPLSRLGNVSKTLVAWDKNEP